MSVGNMRCAGKVVCLTTQTCSQTVQKSRNKMRGFYRRKQRKLRNGREEAQKSKKAEQKVEQPAEPDWPLHRNPSLAAVSGSIS